MKDSIAVAHFFCFGLNAPVIMARGGPRLTAVRSHRPSSQSLSEGGGAGVALGIVG